ncbi:hypothetical protein QCA50_013225 [Cerrena zonata]|uniref:Uncharacterized protein n=1 Tax=Cerrena zonata TaxID=2478898 RepID=A0AAW0G2R2_9APHY
MLSWLSNVFQGETSQSDDPSLPSSDQGNSKPNSHMDVYVDVETGTLPPLERPRLNSKSSSLTLDRKRPSQVSWIPSNSSSGSGPGTPKSSGRPSASPGPTPSPEPSTPRSGFLGFPRRLNGQKPSTESLRIPPNAKEEKTLSPIEEREHEHSSSDATATIHFPSGSTRRPSLDSFPKTPDSASCTSSRLPNTTSKQVYKPLSTNTLQSTVSVQAPSIPPIDFRPSFPGSNGYLAPPPARKSHFTPPSLPTVAGSPPSHVSVIYEDRGNPSKMSVSSFRTAGSRPHLPQEVDIVDGRGLGLQHDVPEDVRLGGSVNGQEEWRWSEADFRVTYADTDSDSDTGTLEHTIQHHDHDEPPTYPEGLYDEIDLGRPPARASWHVNPFDDPDGHILEHHQRHSDQSSLDHIPIRPPQFTDFDRTSQHTFSTTSSTTRVEFAIHSRWLKCGDYPTSHIICEPRKEKKKLTAAAARSYQTVPYLHIVDQHYPKGTKSQPTAHNHNPDPSHGSGPNRKRGFLERLRTHWHRQSNEALPMTMKDVKAYRQSHPSSGTNAQRIDSEYACPWVHRCRVAAVVGGAALLTAVVVALVVLSAIHTT